MLIREYRRADLEEISALFFNTVHKVNAKDYTKDQLYARAPDIYTLRKNSSSFLNNHCIVAEERGTITGFADISEEGYLDHLFVHEAFQGRGIATALCDVLEKQCKAARIFTHASLTARPFFEKRGYSIIKEQTTERRGQLLRNFLMEKAVKE